MYVVWVPAVSWFTPLVLATRSAAGVFTGTSSVLGLQANGLPSSLQAGSPPPLRCAVLVPAVAPTVASLVSMGIVMM
ncbi:hypothetical protein D3C71_1958610 [compost metagenome]